MFGVIIFALPIISTRELPIIKIKAIVNILLKLGLNSLKPIELNDDLSLIAKIYIYTINIKVPITIAAVASFEIVSIPIRMKTGAIVTSESKKNTMYDITTNKGDNIVNVVECFLVSIYIPPYSILYNLCIISLIL